MGAVYDVFSIIRVFLGVSFSKTAEGFLQAHKHPLLRPLKRRTKRPLFLKISLFLTDFIFSLFSAISIILLFYGYNNGQIRVPVLGCLAVGFLTYRLTLGRLVLPILEVVAVLIKNILFYVLFWILFPFKKAIQMITKILVSVYTKLVKRKRRKQRIRFTKAEKRRLEQESCGML